MWFTANALFAIAYGKDLALVNIFPVAICPIGTALANVPIVLVGARPLPKRQVTRPTRATKRISAEEGNETQGFGGN
jgi:hypothetical protein